MSAYRYSCPHCSNPFAVEADTLGRAVACPVCQGAVQIPSADMTRGAATQTDPRSPPELPVVPDRGGPPTLPPVAPTAEGAPDLPDPMAPVVRDRDPAEPIAKEDSTALPETAVEDRPKTIVYKGQTIELRKVSPEEKQRRRWRRRIVMIVICSGVLIYYLLRGAGKI